MKFKLALAQFAPRLGDVDSNLKHMLDLTGQARAREVNLLIFPELALTGYYVKDLATTVAVRATPQDSRFAPLLEASRALDMVVGFVQEDARHRCYIAAAYLSEGRVVHVHRKVYLPTYRLFDDARFFARGQELHISPRSYERYDYLADAAASIDPAGAARVYSTLKPRIEEAYRDLGNGMAATVPRYDVFSPTKPGEFYEYKTMSGVLPARNVAALRLNSSVVKWYEKAGGIRKDKLPVAGGDKFVGLVMLFSTERCG